MGFLRQEYCSGLPFPPPGDLCDLGIEPEAPVSPALADEFFTTEPPGKPQPNLNFAFKCSRPTIALELSTAERQGYLWVLG